MTPDTFRRALLQWYDVHRRDLPWRAKSGVVPDPYHVWLSEIMLQQTTVGAVKAYFEKFLDVWPTVHDLARAAQEDVMAAWAGLGYYARARNLHKCAQVVAKELSGQFPRTQKALKDLPGIGDYTSAAIMTIAYDKPAVVVDGNVERIVARYFAVKDPLPNAKPILKKKSAVFFEGFSDRHGDFAQAMMDLGSAVCIAKAPRCALCPVKDGCRAYADGDPETYPRRAKKKPKPQRRGGIYYVSNDEGDVLLHQRPNKGLLGGTLALPTSAWTVEVEADGPHLPFLSDIRSQKTQVFHSFTHFDLTLYLYAAKAQTVPDGYMWVDPSQIDPDHFPSVFKKALLGFIDGAV